MATTEKKIEARFAQPGAITSLASYRGERIKWDLAQREFLADTSRQIALVKSRQIGGSLLAAAVALERCLVRDSHEVVVTSYSREAAQRIVKVARALYQSLPIAALPERFRRPMTGNAATRLTWSDARGSSLIVAKPPLSLRGEGGPSVDVVIDEAAFVPDCERVLAEAAPITSGGGSIFVLGTPFGATGVFHKIVEDVDGAGQDWSLHDVPWFASHRLCRAPSRAEQWMRAHPTATLDQTITVLGTAELIRQWKLLGCDEHRFLEEFSTVFHDGKGAVFSHALIQRCTSASLKLADDWVQLDRPKGVIIGGADIGGANDPGECVLLEHDPVADRTRLVMRHRFAPGTPVDHQRGYIDQMLRGYPHVASFRVDSTGIGWETGAILSREHENVTGQFITAPTKMQMVEHCRARMAARKLSIPADRELASQLAAIKEKPSSISGVRLYDFGRKDGAHGDFAFAMMLGLLGTKGLEEANVGTVAMRIIGGEGSLDATLRDDVLVRVYETETDEHLQLLFARLADRTDDEAEQRRRAIQSVIARRAADDERAARGLPPLPRKPEGNEYERAARTERLFDAFVGAGKYGGQSFDLAKELGWS